MIKNWADVSIDDSIKIDQYEQLEKLTIHNNGCGKTGHNIISATYTPGKNSSFFDRIYGRCDSCGKYFKRTIGEEESKDLMKYFKENKIL